MPSLTVGLLTLPPMQSIQATTPDQIDLARQLFREYESWLGLSLCFQNFEKELAELPGAYAEPDGRLLLAYYNGELAGCVALRKFDERTCEMKRLFVRDTFRGQGIGRFLIETIIRDAKEIGYERILLDTLPPRMNDAIALYRSIGFKEIAPYYDNPVEGPIFMEFTIGTRASLPA
jgi:GNAT superfamily N-acetyltransferase